MKRLILALGVGLVACSGASDDAPSPDETTTLAPTAPERAEPPPTDAGVDVAEPAPDAAKPPTDHTLDTSVVRHMVEPEGTGKDDKGQSYSDANYWNFCSAGAVAAALAYDGRAT